MSNVRSVTISIGEIVSPFSVLYLHYYDANNDVWLLPNGLEKQVIQYPISVRHLLLEENEASAYCTVWIDNIYGEVVVDEAVAQRIYEERFATVSACITFVQKRIGFSRFLWLSRAEAMDQNSNVYENYSYTDANSYPLTLDPFQVDYDEYSCSEPIWCGHALELQRRIYLWQFPDVQAEEIGCGFVHTANTHGMKRTCENSRFLVYEAPSRLNGIGSMLHVTATALRYALCLNRILILSPSDQATTLTKWRHPGCSGNTFDCYFQQLSGCKLTEHDLADSYISENGHNFDEYPFRDRKVLILKGLPTNGPCSLCNDRWIDNSPIFNGCDVDVNHFEECISFRHDYKHFKSFKSSMKLTWVPNILRYLMRPKPWFVDLLKETISATLYSPNNTSMSKLSDFSFISLHVRYGMKVAEEALEPLGKYMAVAKKKLPHLKKVFLSTESEFVISTLIR